MFSTEELLAGARSGLVQFDPDVPFVLHPQLVLNDLAKGEKVLEFLLENISTCREFRFAVAFVTRSGVACLHETLKEFFARGGRGEILVSSYLNFSDPYAIKALKNFKGLDVKFVSAPNFHGKTFLFNFGDYFRVLVGSSNLTQDALGKNTEINVTVSLKRGSALFNDIETSLNHWSVTAEEISDQRLLEYEVNWNASKKLSQSISYDLTQANYQEERFPAIQPNAMQVKALANLNAVRQAGHKKSLIISATGTGKTVLSALDVKQMGAKRMLFVVHRLNIAKKAMSEFRKVFKNTKTMGLYTGSAELDTKSDFIFSTIQTINTQRHITNFSPVDFDYVIIDETHRAGADTYQTVLNYFKPGFLLGMTATPERTDGFDIFALFNHSIAFEIRLQSALEADLLCPFHYFGISDIDIEDQVNPHYADFNKLTSNRRIEHIINALEEYGVDNATPRGLIFCSRIEEAKALADGFNQRGIPSLAISGSDSESFREKAIERFESNGPTRLKYLFTVDIFNEGIDIPSINQIVMLRPTSSAIVFVQQLGRGLRKASDKEYLTVIDFIGNYDNNYLIPMALFGDSSYNKDKLRRLLSAGSGLIPGSSSISFERIAKERVFKSIDSTKLDNRRALREDYRLLKFRIGRTPMMMDFVEQNSRDPYQYASKAGESLLKFAIEQDSSINADNRSLRLLSYLSLLVCNGRRLEDAVILEQLLTKGKVSIADIQAHIEELASYRPSVQSIHSAIHSLNLMYDTESVGGRMVPISETANFFLIKVESDQIQLDSDLIRVLADQVSKAYFIDLAQCAISKFLGDYACDQYYDGFKLTSKYSRRDVFRILDWGRKPVDQNVGGYLRNSNDTVCPIFLTYKKSENIAATINYEDRFLNPAHLIYMSKVGRTLNSPDVAAIRNQSKTKMRIPFFLKKSDDEGVDFYYLGDLSAIPEKFEDTLMSDSDGAKKSVVKMEFILNRPVEHNLYRYITDFDLYSGN
jgi:superfamily II DNA or RNA helicase/HKD family nuclease